jgi:putative hemolysin
LDPELLNQEVNNLPASQTLVHSGKLTVCYARAAQIPHLLEEIGRLREVTFRKVHEGTGKAFDLDRFDAHYLHLFLWNHEKQEAVGAYRLGGTDQIMASLGSQGLYTTTLFDFEAHFLKEIYPALELGRSFIREEYQKNYTALLLLWKGIGQFVVRNPQYQILFGPVSISNAYNEFSQGLLATWLSMHNFLPELAQFIRPKNPFQVKENRNRDLRLALAGTREVEEISALIADVDPKQKGMPILLKQYLKLGGKLLGFNRDPHFNNVLDGLILVDLLQTPHQVLQRYMGKEGLADFLQYHSRPYYADVNQPAGNRCNELKPAIPANIFLT